MKFSGNKYGNQFITTEEEEKEFMHDMHKIALDAKFTQMSTKKLIQRHRERAIEDMYEENTQTDDMKVMEALEPIIITKSHEI